MGTFGAIPTQVIQPVSLLLVASEINKTAHTIELPTKTITPISPIIKSIHQKNVPVWLLNPQIGGYSCQVTAVLISSVHNYGSAKGVPDVDQGRLIIDCPTDGLNNMAIDEAMLTSAGQAGPTMRFYRWSEPTISLGHFQKFAEAQQLDPPFNRLAVVRRITGGGAILHDAELTYSLVLSANHRLVDKRGPQTLYLAVHRALIAVLSSFGLSAQLREGARPASQQKGPFFCFERANRSDVMVSGRKISGSAQRHTLKALLQHGSLMLDNPLGQPGLTTLAEHKLSRPVDADTLARAWADELAKTLELNFVQGKLSEAETALAEQLRTKYASDEWTKRR